jgi:hypothetical protein
MKSPHRVFARLDQPIFTALNDLHYQVECYSESLAANLFADEISVSAKRTASCERLSDVAMLGHDATYQADMDEVAKADPGARA